jgi:hypothetical protein
VAVLVFVVVGHPRRVVAHPVVIRGPLVVVMEVGVARPHGTVPLVRLRRADGAEVPVEEEQGEERAEERQGDHQRGNE